MNLTRGVPGADMIFDGDALRDAHFGVGDCSPISTTPLLGGTFHLAGLAGRMPLTGDRDGLCWTGATASLEAVGNWKNPVEMKGEGRIGV